MSELLQGDGGVSDWVAHSGLEIKEAAVPGAMSWAEEFRPFGADLRLFQGRDFELVGFAFAFWEFFR